MALGGVLILVGAPDESTPLGAFPLILRRRRLVGSLIGGKIGRRPTFFGLCLGSLLICTFLFRVLSEYNSLFIVTVFFAGCFTAAFYGWFPLYLPELFLTRMRATGQGVSYNFGRVFAAVGAVAALIGECTISVEREEGEQQTKK
jgi:hypothetical protein